MVDRVKPWFMVLGLVHGSWFIILKDFSVSPSPLGTDWDLGLTGLGLGWVRDRLDDCYKL